MPNNPFTITPPTTADTDLPTLEIRDNGVIWSAVIGGTIAASAFLLLLVPLGTGLGFVETSWQDPGHMHKAFTLMSAVWLIIVQWISSGVGGYLTGRLRTGWAGAHTHEVFFRDTAHGFLTWALTTVASVLLLAAGVMHTTDRHGSYDRMSGPGSTDFLESYAVNRLFRSDQPNAHTVVTDRDRADAALVLSHNAKDTALSDADKSYLTQLVGSRTGLAPAEAQKRVEDTTSQLHEFRKEAHKYVALSEVFVFVSMWIGAFIASAAGALGGQHRDMHYKHGTLFAD